jgi:nucleoid DNA-binding protein
MVVPAKRTITRSVKGARLRTARLMRRNPTGEVILMASKNAVAKPSAQPTVTLKHLAAKLSKSHDLSKKETEAVLGDLVNLVAKHLKKGDRVRVGGLGTLANLPARNLAAEIAHEPAESAYQPSPRAQALLRGKEICESDLRDSGGAFTWQEVKKLLGISRQAIDKKVRADALLAVPGPHGRRQYPVAQFTGDGILLGLEDVLKSLPSANGWFRLNFLVRPDARLGGRRPIDLLKESKIDPVVVAAKAVGVQGA